MKHISFPDFLVITGRRLPGIGSIGYFFSSMGETKGTSDDSEELH